MQYTVINKCPDYNSFRAEKVKAMFNVTGEQSASFEYSVDLPIEDREWSLGSVIGGSGTGKTSLGKKLLGGGALHEGFDWSSDRPIIDCLQGDFKKITGALTSVGLGTVPSWLKPYQVLSMGEKFRADLARIILEAPPAVVIDEFTSVVDRQIAQIGSSAFAKAWRKTGGESCNAILPLRYN